MDGFIRRTSTKSCRIATAGRSSSRRPASRISLRSRPRCRLRFRPTAPRHQTGRPPLMPSSGVGRPRRGRKHCAALPAIDVNYEVEINGRIRQVAVARADASFHVTIDGRRFEVDATRIDARAWSLIVSGGDDVRLKPDTTTTTGDEVRLTPDATTGRAVGPRKTEAVSAFRR